MLSPIISAGMHNEHEHVVHVGCVFPHQPASARTFITQSATASAGGND